MTSSLQLKLFGSPQITYQGQPLTGFVSIKVRALLIYLAVTARPHSRDHLAHLLWEDTPASMKTNLRKALSNLRQLIGDLLVEEGKELIALDPQRCWVDVVAFEHALKSAALTEAAQLYTADFLDGFNPSLSYEFEAWTLREQSRLKSGMVDLLRKLATQQETRNTLPEAIQTVRRLLALEPWQEESHRWLMELLAMNGQRSAALAHFEVCKRVLQEELAVEPSAETLKLVAKIQRASPSPSKPQPKPVNLPKPEFPLIGREREWQMIQAAWGRCLQHGPHFVAIAGEAGIGKTRLLEEARLLVAGQGYASVYARSYAAEGALAYSPVIDWLRSEPIRSALDQLDTIWLNEIVRLLPELLKRYPQLSHPKPISDAAQRRLFFEAMAQAVTVIEQPLLLVIDDLQWCDRETLEWLRFLLRIAPHFPFLIVGAFRVEEVDKEHPLQTLWQTLRREEIVTEFELGPLNATDTSSLIQQAASNRISLAQAAALWQTTLGHPLFVIESLRNVDEQGLPQSLPKKVQNVIQARLAQLSPEARELVEIAAVIGRGFSGQLLLLVGQRHEDRFYQQVDELWQRRMITERDTAQFDFSHDRIREAIYATLNPLYRQRLHHRVAKAMKSLYGEQLTEMGSHIAIHYQLAGDFVSAIPHFVYAIQTSLARWSLEEALALVVKALTVVQSLPESEEYLRYRLTLYTLQLETITQYQGYMHPQRPLIIAQISEVSKKLQDQQGYYLAQTKLRHYHSLRAEWVLAREIAEANIALAQQNDNPDMISEAYIVLARVYFYMGDLLTAKVWYDRGKQIVETVDPTARRFDAGQPPQVNAFTNIAHCYCLLGYLHQADHLRNRAIAIAETSQHPHAMVEGLNFSLILDFMMQNTHAVPSKAEQIYAIAEKYNLPFYSEMSKLYQGWSLLIAGCYDEAITQMKRIVEHFVAAGLGMFYALRLGMVIEAYRMAQRYAEGLAAIHEALAFADRTSDLFWVPELYRLQGELLLGKGAESHEVEESYQKSLEISRQQSSRLLELRSSVSLARLWQSQGKHAEAYQLLAPIYAWFTEGFDTPDLLEAKQLLGELTV